MLWRTLLEDLLMMLAITRHQDFQLTRFVRVHAAYLAPRVGHDPDHDDTMTIP